MQARYGLQFSRQWHTEAERKLALREWGERLGELTPEQIAAGLSAWRGTWPPNVEEFRHACTGDCLGLTHNTAAYRRFDKMLPRPKGDKKKAADEIAKMRECLRR